MLIRETLERPLSTVPSLDKEWRIIGVGWVMDGRELGDATKMSHPRKKKLLYGCFLQTLSLVLLCQVNICVVEP